jgi:hypothetical protein
VLQQVLGLGVDVELACLGEVEGRHLGDVLVLALALLLLQLEGNAADGAALDALHQVGGVAGNLVSETSISLQLPKGPALQGMVGNQKGRTHLVAQALRGDDGDLIAQPLVGLEVERQLGVVPLNDDLGGLLDGLGANATHLDGLLVLAVAELMFRDGGFRQEGIAGLAGSELFGGAALQLWGGALGHAKNGNRVAGRDRKVWQNCGSRVSLREKKWGLSLKKQAIALAPKRSKIAAVKSDVLFYRLNIVQQSSR